MGMMRVFPDDFLSGVQHFSGREHSRLQPQLPYSLSLECNVAGKQGCDSTSDLMLQRELLRVHGEDRGESTPCLVVSHPLGLCPDSDDG